MKEKLKTLRFKSSELINKHEVFVVLAILLFISAMVIFRLISMSNIEPDQGYIDDQTISIQPIKFDEDAIEKIEDLRDSNVKDLGTQIQNNRENPFSE